MGLADWLPSTNAELYRWSTAAMFLFPAIAAAISFARGRLAIMSTGKVIGAGAAGRDAVRICAYCRGQLVDLWSANFILWAKQPPQPNSNQPWLRIDHRDWPSIRKPHGWEKSGLIGALAHGSEALGIRR